MKLKLSLFLVVLNFGCTGSMLHSDRGDLFTARDLDLYPRFIDEFFPGSSLFTKHYPTVEMASKGLLLVEVRRLTDTDINNNEANLAWSYNGENIGYELITKTHRKIIVKDLKGFFSKEIVVLPKKKSSLLANYFKRKIHSYNGSLRWSSDSKNFAFMSNGGQGNFNIYVGGIGKEEFAIAEDSKKDGYATWNPTESEVVFISARTGNGDLYSYNIDNKRITRITESSDLDMYPEWHPHKNIVVYTSGSSNITNLMMLFKSAKGWNAPEKLSDWDYESLRPTFSPNGEFLAFYSNFQTGGGRTLDIWNLHVIRFSEAHHLNQDSLARSVVAQNVVLDLNVGPAWTPDSRKVLYVSNEPEKFNPIYGYDLKSGQRYLFETGTKMNRDIQMSRLGILSFRAQVGSWDRVFLALTNQGLQIQGTGESGFDIKYQL